MTDFDPEYRGPLPVRKLAPGVFGEDLAPKEKKGTTRTHYGWRLVPAQAAWIHVSTTVLYEAIRSGKIEGKYRNGRLYVRSSLKKSEVLARRGLARRGRAG